MAYTKAQINKIGNMLVYITSKLGRVSKTKLLKLIYIIEEEYVKKAGTTLTDLSYTHLPNGPVSTFIYNQIEKRREPLTNFIKIEKEDNSTWLKPVVAFNDDEFSDFDLEVIDEVLAAHGRKTAKELIDYTHSEGSLWKKIEDEYNGKPPAKTHIDLLLLLDNQGVDIELKRVSKEEKAFINYLTTES